MTRGARRDLAAGVFDVNVMIEQCMSATETPDLVSTSAPCGQISACGNTVIFGMLFGSAPDAGKIIDAPPRERRAN